MLKKIMEKHNIADERISIRIAGCPNGCSRPYNGDIGIVGRTPDHYAIFIGGDFEGTRLNSKILDKVPYENLSELFDFLFAHYTKHRLPEEGYGNFAHRFGYDAITSHIRTMLGDKYSWARSS